MLLTPGRVVDRFGVEALLGEGAAARVYRARDRRTDRLVALKVLSAPTAAHRARLEREVELLRSIDHPNVVAVEGLIELGAPVLVMEYVEGPSLRQRTREGPLSAGEIDVIARGLMAGAGALHAAGVIHRDLTPANILLGRRDAPSPRIVDLGVARRARPALGARLTRTGAVLGTPPYLAPEQLQDSHRVDHRADLWALGCVLFELLCGRRPFTGSSLQAFRR